MMKTLRLVGAYIGQFAKGRIAYRWDFLVEIATFVLSIGASMAFLLLLFWGGGIRSIHGWSRAQCIFIYAFSMIAVGIFNLVSVNFWHFASEFIMEGRLDRLLVRPVPVLLQVLCERIRVSAVVEILIGAGLVGAVAPRVGIDWTPGSVLGLTGLALCGGTILIAVFVLCASVSFWFEDRMGVGAPVFNLIQFGRYPIDIHTPAVQWMLRWVIPFGFIGFYPSSYFIAGERFTGGLATHFWMTPVVTVGFTALALAVFHRGIRRYHSTGS